MNVYEPLSGMTLGSLYQGAGRSTVERTNPTPDTGAAATIATNAGVPSAVLGIQLPVLLALGALAVILVRYYD